MKPIDSLRRRGLLGAVSAGALGAAGVRAAFAQSGTAPAWPAKLVRIVVPYTPGTTASLRMIYKPGVGTNPGASVPATIEYRYNALSSGAIPFVTDTACSPSLTSARTVIAMSRLRRHNTGSSSS